MILSCSDDKSLKISRVKDGSTVQVLNGHSSNVALHLIIFVTVKVKWCDVSMEGNILSCSSDKTLKIWTAGSFFVIICW